MKFLLVAINAKYIHSNLAVYSLKAFAEKYGNNNNEIEIAEYTINQYSDDILRDIYKENRMQLVFHAISGILEWLRRLLEIIRRFAQMWMFG